MSNIKINSGTGSKVYINHPSKPALSINRLPEQALRVVKTIAEWSGDTDTNFQRMPVIMRLSETQARILFVQRHSSRTVGDGQGMRLVSKLVTVDPVAKTITAGATEIIDEPDGYTEGLEIANHPQLCKLTFGPNAGRWVLLNNRNMNETGESGPTLFYSVFRRYSDDDGATWSTAEEVVVGTEGNYQAVPGNGDIVEIPTGRLIAPMYVPSYQYALISDDHGETWYKSDSIFVGGGISTSEPTMALCPDGSLLMTIRIDSSPFTRYTTKSTDGGETWSAPAINSDLVGPACNYSSYGDSEKVLLSSPVYPGQRFKGRIRRSLDNGATWSDYYQALPNNQSFGYSCVRPLSDDFLMIACESNSFGQMGFNLNEHIKVIVVNQKEIDDYLNPPEITEATNASDYYDAYETRVLADGGVITDSTATLAAIQFALDYGIQDVTIAVSARWGVKVDGVNIEKLYSLFSATGDVVSTGTGGDYYKVNTDLAYARIAAPTIISSKWLKSSAFTPLTGKRFGIAISGTTPDSIKNIRVALEIADVSSPLAFQINSQTAQATILGSDDDFTGFMTLQTYADNSGMVSVGDQDGGVLYQFTDGEEIATTGTTRPLTPVSGELADFASMSAELLIGCRKQDSVYYGSSNVFFNEVWWITDITNRIAAALSDRLTLYQTT